MDIEEQVFIILAVLYLQEHGGGVVINEELLATVGDRLFINVEGKAQADGYHVTMEKMVPYNAENN